MTIHRLGAHKYRAGEREREGEREGGRERMEFKRCPYFE